MPQIFETPTDLVGHLTQGDLLMDANNQLLLVGEPCKPSSFPEGSAVAGQHYLLFFADEVEFVPGYHTRRGPAWPLRRVRVIDDDRISDSPAAEFPGAETDRACAEFAPIRDGRTGNGLPVYTEFADLNGARVYVQGSSLASHHAARIYVSPAEEDLTATATSSGIVHPAKVPVSVHLCRAMAWEVRDALDRFLAEPVEDELACERRVDEAPDRSDQRLCVCLGICLATGRCHALDPADSPTGA